jgi:hypothetical protein
VAKDLVTAPVVAKDTGYALVSDDEQRGSFWIFASAGG